MQYIDMDRFKAAIREAYPTMAPAVADRYAQLWLSQIDPQLFGVLNCWINKTPISGHDIQIGEFSVKRIVSIRADGDYLRAILLLSEYIRNPNAGRAKIFAPKR